MTWPLYEAVVDDAAYLAAIGGVDDLIDAAADALHRPHWPLFLGRREYPSTLPLLLDVVDTSPLDAILAHPRIAPPSRDERATLWRVRPLARSASGAREEIGVVDLHEGTTRGRRRRRSRDSRVCGSPVIRP